MEPRIISADLYEALLNLESAGKALLLSANDREFVEAKYILGCMIRRVQCIRDAEILAHRDYVRAMQASRKADV